MQAATQWHPKPTKKATFEAIRCMLAVSDRALVRGMLAIFEKQTSDEQAGADVKHHNGVGFTVHDAHLLTSYSQQVLCGRNLSEKQMVWVRKMMPKYAGQLAKIAIAKHGLAA